MAAELTVGLIAHDDPIGLVRSAQCVFHQSWTGKLTLSIIDDGCTNRTVRAIRWLEERYDQVNVLRLPLRTGLACSRNQVLKTADTRFLAWIDAGDLWHPRKLELQFQALRAEPSCRFVFSQFPDCLADGFTLLLGETECFRRIGELDERLSCLADEEFLLRLVLSGLCTTTAAIPRKLCTSGNKPRKDALPCVAVEASAVWRKHKRRIEKGIGRSAAAAYRRRQFLGLADAAARDKRSLRAAHYRTMARLTGLRKTSGVPRRASRHVRRGAAGAGLERILRVGARLITFCRVEPASPLIAGIVKFMQSASAGKRVVFAPAFSDFVGSGMAASKNEDQVSFSACRVLTVAAAAIATGKPERAVQVLEAHIDAHGADAHPRMFERLADVHLAVNCPDRADETLRLGLRMYPANGRLHRSLADALARKAKWSDAIAHWEQASESVRATAGVWTSVGVARAYRHSGDAKKAHSVAARAAESQPANDQLEKEIVLCRPFLIEWTRCLLSVQGAVFDQEAVAGAVESMGFLNGGGVPLIGRVAAMISEVSEIHLLVNGKVVASTFAIGAAEPSDGAVFSINCADLLEYLGDGDIIQLDCRGNALTMPGLGTAAMVYCGHSSRFDALADLLQAGYVFTKDGRLRPGHDEKSKRAVLDFYSEVSDLIEAKTGQPVFPFYGNLLGAVRQNDFIAHDVDGFDIVYLCSASGPDDVKAEVLTLCQLLRDSGYHLKIKRWSVMVRKSYRDAMFLDLAYGWFNSADEFHVSYGWRFEPVQGRDRFVARRACWLVDRFVRVPGNAEEVIEQLYGSRWPVPDQGFSVDRFLIRDDDYLLTLSEIDSDNHQDRPSTTRASGKTTC